ncbi:BA3454 family stress response protein [Neobacillus sp. M.A.Huq-85]
MVNYLTNVIVKKETSEKQILEIEEEQIKRQWIN